MPTASRCWCGRVDSPGSAICSSAMKREDPEAGCGCRRLPTRLRSFFAGGDRVVDLRQQFFLEHQASHAIGGLFEVVLVVEQRGDLLMT
ncbi:MAG: hypothetical protein AW12_02645 [Candidatus Accumulibacter sp. BA-94]|nr:MAG: hypothetical protein AW12_02645 [Candidatus Accumulibacter sp. BA-94]